MSIKNPQAIPPGLDPRVFSILHSAIPALVHPTVNALVAATVPSLIAALDQATPHADASTRGCLHAGLWLLADDLPTAHKICQDIPTAHGSAWHAHLHRREGDFSNAKYWWRRAYDLAWQAPGNPPMHEQVTAALRRPPQELLAWHKELRSSYDPSHFVDLVEKHHDDPNPALTTILQQVQRLEWGELFLECYAAAGGQ